MVVILGQSAPPVHVLLLSHSKSDSQYIHIIKLLDAGPPLCMPHVADHPHHLHAPPPCYHSKPCTLQTIGEDLFAIAVDQPFRFPATFTFVLRAFSTLEGIGKTLNPDYNFSAVATPYAQELLQLQDAQQQQGFVIAQFQQQATEVRLLCGCLGFGAVHACFGLFPTRLC